MRRLSEDVRWKLLLFACSIATGQRAGAVSRPFRPRTTLESPEHIPPPHVSMSLQQISGAAISNPQQKKKYNETQTTTYLLGLAPRDQHKLDEVHLEAPRHQRHHQRALDGRPPRLEQALDAARGEGAADDLGPEGGDLVGPVCGLDVDQSLGLC